MCITNIHPIHNCTSVKSSFSNGAPQQLNDTTSLEFLLKRIPSNTTGTITAPDEPPGNVHTRSDFLPIFAIPVHLRMKHSAILGR